MSITKLLAYDTWPLGVIPAPTVQEEFWVSVPDRAQSSVDYLPAIILNDDDTIFPQPVKKE